MQSKTETIPADELMAAADRLFDEIKETVRAHYKGDAYFNWNEVGLALVMLLSSHVSIPNVPEHALQWIHDLVVKMHENLHAVMAESGGSVVALVTAPKQEPEAAGADEAQEPTIPRAPDGSMLQ